MKKLLCFLGFHKVVTEEKWIPSFGAEIVSDYEFTATCKHCGKVLGHHYLKWNGEEFVEMSP